MGQLLSYLPFLACPIGMGLMMWMMMRGGRHGQQPSSAAEPEAMAPAHQAELAQLRAELDQWRNADRTHSSGIGR